MIWVAIPIALLVGAAIAWLVSLRLRKPTAAFDQAGEKAINESFERKAADVKAKEVNEDELSKDQIARIINRRDYGD